MRLRREAAAPVVLGALALSGCVTVPITPQVVAQLDHIVMQLAFDCDRDGSVRANVTGTQIILSTSAGAATYSGAYPTYFSHESSISFVGEYGSFVLVRSDSRQMCVLTGMA